MNKRLFIKYFLFISTFLLMVPLKEVSAERQKEKLSSTMSTKMKKAMEKHKKTKELLSVPGSRIPPPSFIHYHREQPRKCSKDRMRIRRNVKRLSLDEWKLFKRSLHFLYTHTSAFGEPIVAETEKTKKESKLSFIDYLTKLHWDFGDDVHTTPRFLPWHRMIVWRLENELRKLNPSLSVPYWDFSEDASNPKGSFIFSKEYLETDDKLIQSYSKQNKTVSASACRWPVHHSDYKCAYREWDEDLLKKFTNPKEFLGNLTNADGSTPSFEKWHYWLEYNPHYTVHTSLGGKDLNGDMGTNNSPNDPVFWVFHSFIDKLWVQRQKLFAFGWDEFEKDLNPYNMNLPPWNMTIAETMDYASLCYDYE